jgi:cytochrome o ubiquinol oxidase subunit 3
MARLKELHHHAYSKTVFGLWIFLMSDAMMFGALFATYAVLQGGTAGGPTAADLFHLPMKLGQTLLLLAASFACGPGVLAAHRDRKNETLLWFSLAFALSLIFFGLQAGEFVHLVKNGITWERSAFLSSYFNLVGTLAVHVAVGLLWIAFMVVQILTRGLTFVAIKRLTCLRMFLQFVNIVWIFIFTFVYLLGAK